MDDKLWNPVLFKELLRDVTPKLTPRELARYPWVPLPGEEDESPKEGRKSRRRKAVDKPLDPFDLDHHGLYPDGTRRSGLLLRRRLAFLDVVHSQIPEVLTDLRSSVFPHWEDRGNPEDRPRSFAPCCRKGDEPGWTAGNVFVINVLPSIIDVRQSNPLQRALLDWSERWELRDRWILDAAWETMEKWQKHEPCPQAGWHPKPLEVSLRFLHVYAELDFRDRWDLQVEERGKAGYRIRDASAKAVRSYMDEVAEEEGNRDHFEWCALYQCKGRHHVDLTDSSVSVQEVGKAIRKAANSLGLTLRDGRGRPAKPQTDGRSEGKGK